MSAPPSSKAGSNTEVGSGPVAEPHDPFEPDTLREMVDGVFDDMMNCYFRPQLVEDHPVFEDGPAIFAGNHSGTAFPWDAMALDCLLWRREGMPVQKRIRAVFEKELSMTWWMRPYGIDNFWRRGGGVDMTFDNFDQLLAQGRRVLYYPEGVPGIGKGFNRRYQLQRFSSSFVIMAARNQAPVVPIYTINAEWVIPFNYTFGPVDRFVKKFCGVPFLPLPAAPLAITFPWMWYLSLPANMIFVTGKPIDVAAKVEAAGITDLDAPDRETMRSVADEVRCEMQTELDRHVATHGKRPYAIGSLCKGLWNALKRGRFWAATPVGWPYVFISRERDRRRPPARNFLHRWLRDWDIVGFYLPLGWFLLALTRNLRKPPYGYRGLSPEERREQEGNFHWHFHERPLKPPS